MDPDPDPGGPKTYGSGFGSATLVLPPFPLTQMSICAMARWPSAAARWRGVRASLCQRHGSADPDPDPDPHQNVMDPQHCYQHVWVLCGVVFLFVTLTQMSICAMARCPSAAARWRGVRASRPLTTVFTSSSRQCASASDTPTISDLQNKEEASVNVVFE
jgi:hypothetical protein